MTAAVATPVHEYPFTDEDFRFIQKSIRELAGIAITDHKREMVYGRVARRVRALGLNSVREYCDYMVRPEHSHEMVEFTNALTTNLTRFFREGHHFDHLAAQLQARAKSNQPKRLRIWSAGCSSGMEAYSAAMIIAVTLPDWQRWDIKILATDIDTAMLERGKRGIYPLSNEVDIPKAYFSKFCDRVAGTETFEVSASLRQMVHFKQLNLLAPQWPMKNLFDIIFCRNVMIYFDKPTQEALCQKFVRCLPAGGWLYIGHSEHVHGTGNAFNSVGHTIYQRIEESRG